MSSTPENEGLQLDKSILQNKLDDVHKQIIAAEHKLSIAEAPFIIVGIILLVVCIIWKNNFTWDNFYDTFNSLGGEYISIPLVLWVLMDICCSGITKKLKNLRQEESTLKIQLSSGETE